jgi:PIN domain nuclease of toxin-antitoxin system
MITVDTHIIIWEALDPQKLSKKALQQFKKANDSDGIIFCDITLWEISMLISKNRLEIEASFKEFIDLLVKTRNYVFQPITTEIADISNNLLKDLNSDPADRIIAATSLYTNSVLITADKNLQKSKIIKTIW